MIRKSLITAMVIGLALLWVAPAQETSKEGRRQPAPLPDGGFLLPSGWTITPAGRQIPVGSLPLGMALSHDGRYLAVTHGGYDDQTITLIDTATEKVVRPIPIAKAWLGI